jgi:excisionase family DNA binding protein
MQSDSSLLPAQATPSTAVDGGDDCLTYTVAQAARRAGLSVSYYYRAARQGLVPAKFIGRRIVVPKAALHQFLGEPQATPTGGEAA